MEKSVTTAVLEEIEKHLEETIDIDNLAAMSGYSRRRLHDFFKQNCEISIGRYIRQRRLCRSATLLKLTSESITDIAHRLGFDSIQSYSREFKKQFGVSPKIYRKEIFWDLANLRPPFWLVPEVDYPFEICQLPPLTVWGFQMQYQIPTGGLPKEASPLKWKLVRDTLNTWEQTLYCISSFGPDSKNTQVISATSFFGIKAEQTRHGRIPLSRKTEGGKHAKFSFSGTWDEYRHFSNRVYLFCLPKENLRRTLGKDDIEVFYHDVESSTSQSDFMKIDYYIPVE